MRVHAIVPRSAVDGPGQRFCLWVQGCSRRCNGCFNPETWDAAQGSEMSVERLTAEILAVRGIEGITLLGGEPFEQSEELACLCRIIRTQGLSVTAFTGFLYEELASSGDSGTEQLLQQVDLLIDGPYIQEQQDFSRPWIGSSNQRYLFLTDRYSQKDIDFVRQSVEVRVDSVGNIVLSGMPDARMLAWLRGIGGG